MEVSVEHFIARHTKSCAFRYGVELHGHINLGPPQRGCDLASFYDETTRRVGEVRSATTINAPVAGRRRCRATECVRA